MTTLLSLAAEVRAIAVSFSGPLDVVRSEAVSASWRARVGDAAFWRSHCEADFGSESFAPRTQWRDCWVHWRIIQRACSGDDASPLSAPVWLETAAAWHAITSSDLRGTSIVASLRGGVLVNRHSLGGIIEGGIPDALLALWAVHNGQSLARDDMIDRQTFCDRQTPWPLHAPFGAWLMDEIDGTPISGLSDAPQFSGLFGGVSCYSKRHSTRLLSAHRCCAYTAFMRNNLRRAAAERPVAFSPPLEQSLIIAASEMFDRIVVLDATPGPGGTCDVYVGSPADWYRGDLVRACPIAAAAGAAARPGLTAWFSEFAARVSDGVYAVESPFGLSLFPTKQGASLGAHTVTSAVTRGVRVTASTYFYAGNHVSYGFAYSIQIALVEPARSSLGPADAAAVEAGTLDARAVDGSGQPRGVRAALIASPGCQLRGRHWIKTDGATGATSHTRGDGVIGKLPVLRVGGYFDVDGSLPLNGDNVTRRAPWVAGTFVYQSCTGTDWTEGSTFGGTLRFEPGTLDDTRQWEEGFGFDVVVAPFTLATPRFIY